MMLSKLRNIGPGALVTAAFIGPGTVTTSTVAGASFGYTLLWALVFATAATILLQEMSARLGVVTQRGLGETLAVLTKGSFLKWPLFGLIGVALYMGNAAYEGGNLSGAALGIQAIAGERADVYLWSVISIAVLAACLLLAGTYKQIEAVLIGLVMIMAVAFVATFVIVRPDFAALATGLVVPRIPEGALMTVIALIGTTVVPYNLFLHAATAKARWNGPGDLRAARNDTAFTIGLGGVITMLIVSTAAASMFSAGITVANASDMARQFEPLFGSFSRYLLGVGFFAAGLSSAITAPLATSYAMTEILQLEGGQSSWVFRIVLLSVILCGTVLALTGISPVSIILSAQFANGLLLPVIATFLLYAMNQKKLLGIHVNGFLGNALGAGVVLLTAGLGLRLILRTFGIL
jgi:manganese transport protein